MAQRESTGHQLRVDTQGQQAQVEHTQPTVVSNQLVQNIQPDVQSQTSLQGIEQPEGTTSPPADPMIPPSVDICALPNCNKPVSIDPNTEEPIQYCSRGHMRLALSDKHNVTQLSVPGPYPGSGSNLDRTTSLSGPLPDTLSPTEAAQISDVYALSASPLQRMSTADVPNDHNDEIPLPNISNGYQFDYGPLAQAYQTRLPPGPENQASETLVDDDDGGSWSDDDYPPGNYRHLETQRHSGQDASSLNGYGYWQEQMQGHTVGYSTAASSSGTQREPPPALQSAGLAIGETCFFCRSRPPFPGDYFCSPGCKAAGEGVVRDILSDSPEGLTERDASNASMNLGAAPIGQSTFLTTSAAVAPLLMDDYPDDGGSWSDDEEPMTRTSGQNASSNANKGSMPPHNQIYETLKDDYPDEGGSWSDDGSLSQGYPEVGQPSNQAQAPTMVSQSRGDSLDIPAGSMTG
ncbi:hypothetical protein FRC15_006731 [Serendipita sp. 397]|nr:hypothetical protein FRC15_006731 [Serendipita sp. 397]